MFVCQGNLKVANEGLYPTQNVLRGVTRSVLLLLFLGNSHVMNDEIGQFGIKVDDTGIHFGCLGYGPKIRLGQAERQGAENDGLAPVVAHPYRVFAPSWSFVNNKEVVHEIDEYLQEFVYCVLPDRRYVLCVAETSISFLKRTSSTRISWRDTYR
jgi:hypothetical protein